MFYYVQLIHTNIYVLYMVLLIQCVAPYVHYVQPRLDIPLAPTSVPPPPAGGRGATLKAAAGRAAPADWGVRWAQHPGKTLMDATLRVKVFSATERDEHRRHT